MSHKKPKMQQYLFCNKNCVIFGTKLDTKISRKCFFCNVRNIQTDQHCDSMTESAKRADSVIIRMKEGTSF